MREQPSSRSLNILGARVRVFSRNRDDGVPEMAVVTGPRGGGGGVNVISIISGVTGT